MPATWTGAKVGESVTINCKRGHFPFLFTQRWQDKPNQDITSWTATCNSEGKYDMEYQGCTNGMCGTIPDQPGTEPQQKSLDKIVLRFLGRPARFDCLPGYTVGGIENGFASYDMSCDSEAELTGWLIDEQGVRVRGGTSTGEVCMPVAIPVSFLVTQNGRPVSGATLTIEGPIGGDSQTITETLFGPNYSNDMAPGSYTVTAVMPPGSGGAPQTTKTMVVSEPIYPFAGHDIDIPLPCYTRECTTHTFARL